MNDLIVRESTDVESIRARILTIRGVQVMLDRDLAELYWVPTGALNQAVKRNKSRFPERFMFQLDKVETENLKSQSVIASLGDKEIAKTPPAARRTFRRSMPTGSCRGCARVGADVLGNFPSAFAAACVSALFASRAEIFAKGQSSSFIQTNMNRCMSRGSTVLGRRGLMLPIRSLATEG